MSVSDRIAVMNAGVIQHIGTPQAIYQRPANLFVAGFIGRANLLPAQIDASGGEPCLVFGGGCRIPMDNLLPEERRAQRAVVSVRPEEFVILPEGGEGLQAVIDGSTFLGVNMHYFLTLSTGERVQVTQEAEMGRVLPAGARVTLDVKRHKINVFSEDGARNLVFGVVNDADPREEARA